MQSKLEIYCPSIITRRMNTRHVLGVKICLLIHQYCLQPPGREGENSNDMNSDSTNKVISWTVWGTWTWYPDGLYVANLLSLFISIRQPACLSIVWFRGHRSKVSEKVTATFILHMYFIKKSTYHLISMKYSKYTVLKHGWYFSSNPTF